MARLLLSNSTNSHLLCRVITVRFDDFDGPHEIIFCQVLIGQYGCHLFHAGSVHGPVVAAGLALATIAGGTVVRLQHKGEVAD